MAEATEAPTGGSILEDREGNLFGIAFDPVGNGNCGVEAIVVALKMLGLLPTNYTVATLRAVVAKFVRENHQFTWLTKVFLALLKEAARFGGDLLAYADHMEKDGMWWPVRICGGWDCPQHRRAHAIRCYLGVHIRHQDASGDRIGGRSNPTKVSNRV